MTHRIRAGGGTRALACALLLLGLSACGGTPRTAGTPGLDVAEAALRGGTPEIALRVASDVVRTNPHDAQALTLQGDAQTALGDTSDAEISYQAALQSDPRDERARLGLARLRLPTNPQQAEALLLQVLDREPRNTAALSDLGIARDLQGHHAAAQQAYRQALGISPEDSAAQVNLALSLAMSGQGDAAQRMIRPMATAPDATRRLRHDYAAVLALSGNRTEAERVLAPDLSPAEIRRFLDTVGAPSRAGTLLDVPQPLATETAVQVQLGALPSEDAAQALWQTLQERAPGVLAGHRPLVTRGEQNGQAFWRLRTGGFGDPAAARAFCEQLRGTGAACMVVTSR